MSYCKTIVCLANSRKISGRCIAGKEISDTQIGSWIRPVSERETREISEEERRYENGRGPRLLDVITIPMKQPMPEAHQSENHLIDSDYYWKKIGEFAWADVPALLDSPSRLWTVNCSGYSGINNRLPASQITQTSLYLIKPDELSLRVGRKAPEYSDSKRAIRAMFHYNRTNYLCDVTDPYVERAYLRQSDGDYNIGSPYICISLGEEYNGYCYKFVAAILTQV